MWKTLSVVEYNAETSNTTSIISVRRYHQQFLRFNRS